MSRKDNVTVNGTYTLGEVETITVPAGKYEAVKVECSDYTINHTNKTFHTSWFAPGVGEVKRIDIHGKSIMELTSFTAGKD